jgi:hypothetical protein
MTAAEPELITRTWLYEFTVPRAMGWPRVDWVRRGSGRVPALQPRKVHVHVIADAQDGGPRVTNISVRGRWIVGGTPAHATPWLRFRVPGREYGPDDALPPGAEVPWLGELAAAALRATGEGG